MPRGNGTGPNGLGPGTGRNAGFCAGYSVPGYMNPVARGRGFHCGREFGQGFRRGIGRGRGCFNDVPWSAADPADGAFDEEKALKSQAEYLEEHLDQVKKRLNELKGKSE